MKKKMLMGMMHTMLALAWFSYIIVAIVTKDTEAEWFAGYGIGAVLALMLQAALFVNWLAYKASKSPEMEKKRTFSKAVFTEEAIREKYAQ